MDKMKMVNMVEEFYLKFGQKEFLFKGYRNKTIDERKYLRFKLFVEEFNEYENALKTENKVEILDAICDMLYIKIGTLLERTAKVNILSIIDSDNEIKLIKFLIKKYNLKNIIDEAFEEVHRSNMSKLDENGKPIFREDGKIIKGSNYFKPDLKQFM